MINETKLNESIDVFSKEIETLRSTSDLYNDLVKLSKEIKADKAEYDKYLNSINKFSQDIEKISNELNSNLLAYDGKITAINEKIEILNTDIQNKINDLTNSLDSKIKEFEKSNETFVEKKFNDLSKEIKNLNYDIQNTIMNYIGSRINETDNKLEIIKNENTANNKSLKMYLIIAIIIGIINIVLKFYK